MTDDVHAEDPAPTAPAATAYGCPVTYSNKQRVIHPTRETWQSVASALFTDGWNMCVDLTAVDYLTYEPTRVLPAGIAPERFEVVAGFISHERQERIRARVQLPDSDPTIGTLYSIYPGTDTLEREVYDLFGVIFEGHPDLSRIMMPEHWEGHPLRKDFATGGIPVQFKASPGTR